MPSFVPIADSFNPHPTICPVCQEVGDQVLLTGGIHEFVCPGCGFLHLGVPEGMKCQKCGVVGDLLDQGIPAIDKAYPAPTPCRRCLGRFQEIERAVSLGGIRTHCSKCGSMRYLPHDNPAVVKYRETEKRVGAIMEVQNCPDCITLPDRQPPTKTTT